MTSQTKSKTQSPDSYVYCGIVESFLGKRAETIISTLISYGRLDVRALSKKSGLSVILVKKTLVSLIQLQCVSVWEEKNLKGETIYYSFKEEGVLLLLYSGEIISYIEQIYKDEKLIEIVQNFLALGNLSIKDYIASFSSNTDEETFHIEKQFLKLTQDGFLIPIEESHFSPIKELWIKSYNKAYNKIPKSSTLSELKRTAEAKASAKLEFNTTLDYKPDNLYIKDKLTSVTKVNPEFTLAFDFKRFLKAKRSIQLTQFCSHRIGKLTSIIYKYALLSKEKKSPEVINNLFKIGLTNEEINNVGTYEPKPDVLISSKDILNILPKEVDLNGSILNGPKKRNANHIETTSNKRIKREDGYLNGIEEESDDDEFNESNFDISKLTIIDQHLRILANASVPLLKKSTNGLYYVPYTELMVHLKQAVSDSVIAGTLGSPSARILRCVRDKRLVSEKLINSVALLKEKEARALTSNLVRFHFLEITEIPKSADRAASKTVFLFKTNEQHSNDFVKQNICWNMGKVLENIKELKESNSLLITKINRDDVKGKELDYLLPSELKQLKSMREKDLELSIRLNRLVSIWEVFKFF